MRLPITMASLTLMGLLVTGCPFNPNPIQEEIPPTATIEIRCESCGPDGTAYAPASFLFDASSSQDDSGIVAALWEFGDGTTGTELQMRHSYSRPGGYRVRLTVVSAQGEKASAEREVAVYQVPAISDRVDHEETDAFQIERVLPNRALKVGETVKIKIRMVAKQELEYAWWREVLPPSLQTKYFLQFLAPHMKAGERIQWYYEVKVLSPGSHLIKGEGRVVRGAEADDLELNTVLQVAN